MSDSLESAQLSSGEVQYESSSSFQIDAATALRKLGQQWATTPYLYLLKCVQAAESLQATELRLRLTREEVEISVLLPGQPDLEGLVAGVVHGSRGGPLAGAVQAALATDNAVRLGWTDAYGGNFYNLGLPPQPFRLNEVAMLRLTVRPNNPVRSWFQRSCLPGSALAELGQRCRFAPLPIWEGGRRLNAPNPLRLPGLQRQPMPRGPLLSRTLGDRVYDFLGSRVLVRAQGPRGFAGPCPADLPGAVTHYEPDHTFGEEKPWPCQLGLVSWAAENGHLELHQCVEEQAFNYTYVANQIQGGLPSSGAFWADTHMRSLPQDPQAGRPVGVLVLTTRYLEPTPDLCLPALNQTGGLGNWRYATRFKALLSHRPRLNFSRWLLLLPTPEPVAQIYVVHQGVLLDPVRVDVGMPGLVAVLDGRELRTDLSGLQVVGSESWHREVEGLRPEYMRLRDLVRPYLTHSYALNLPEATRQLWRAAPIG